MFRLRLEGRSAVPFQQNVVKTKFIAKVCVSRNPNKISRARTKGVDDFSDLDDWMWFLWSEQQECPKCGSTDVEQNDVKQRKCCECEYEWSE